MMYSRYSSWVDWRQDSSHHNIARSLLLGHWEADYEAVLANVDPGLSQDGVFVLFVLDPGSNVLGRQRKERP